MKERIFPILPILVVLVLLVFFLWETPADGVLEQPHKETVTGIVTGATMNTLTLRTDTGAIYAFSIADAVRSGLNGTLPGDTFAVQYEGGTYGGSYTALSYEKKADGAHVPHSDLPENIPAAWLDGGIFNKFYAEAYKKLKTMTLEQKAGQLFLVRFPDNRVMDTIHIGQPAGFVLFGDDFEGKTKDEVTRTLAAVQKVSPIPLLLATDEEGGKVVRISRNPRLANSPFLSPQALFAEGGLEAVKKDASNKAALLKELGLNINLAPVADISTDSKDYIYERTLGQPADLTGDYVKAVVMATQNAGLSATLKHFPGYGNNRDTHTGLAYDGRPYETFTSSDFLPFSAGLSVEAHSVLVSHNIVSCMDPNFPASLSPVVHRILRETLGFTGVIMTDDLAMDAIENSTNELHPAVQALLAGNDLILITDWEEGLHNILLASRNGTIPEETLNRAVFRVLAWKYAKELMK